MNSGSFVNALLASNIGSLSVDKPIMLLIVALPLAVLFTLPFALVTRKENVNGHSIASYIMHIALALLIGFAAAGTSWVTTLTETNVYVVADVSYSANKNLNEIDNIIHNKINLPANSKLGIVCFGKDYELLYEPGDQRRAPSVTKSKVDDSETNIAEALSYTGSLFKEGVRKKIVLITDGKQTDDSDTYAVRRAIDALAALKIEVNAIYLNDNYDPATPEVQISGVEFTKSAFRNHEEWANVSVQASYATRAVLTLSSGTTTLQERLVDLIEGTNVVSFNLDTSKAGTFDYVVNVSAQRDASDYNNTYHFTQSVSAEINVLIIAGDWDTCKALVDQYAPTAAIDAYENDSSKQIAVKNAYWNNYKSNDKIHGYNCNPNVLANYKDVPFTVEELCKYDEIILADIDITTLAGSAEFIRNLDTAISLFGKSLITVGNVYTQDLGMNIYNEEAKATLSSLNGMLPVRYGQSDDDPKLYTLVMDASRSMSDTMPGRFNMEKQIAVNVLSALNDVDEVCIVVFYGESGVLQMPISLDKRDALIDAIWDLEGIQGTVIGGGLNTAYGVIGKLEGYAEKHVLLISDFLDSSNAVYNPTDLAGNALRDYDVVTSCVNVNKSSSSSSNLANAIASAGGGKAYHYNINDNVDNINFDALVGREKDKMPAGNFTVLPSRPNDSVLAGLNATQLPTVNQFLYGISRPSAVTALQVNYQKTGSDLVKPLPLYAYWNYGNGQVTSFTSSLNGTWLQNWQEEQQTLFDNVLMTNTPSEKAAYPYVLNVQQQESFTRIQMIPGDLHFGTEASIKLTLPGGEVVEQALDFDTYYYYYEFKSAEPGKYTIEVNYKYNNVDYSAVTAINVSYSSEYDAFTVFDPAMLFKAVDNRGTVITEGKLTLTNDDNEIGVYSVDFTLGLLIGAVALYVVDICVRKLKWEDIVSFFGGGKKKKQQSEGGKTQ